MRKYRACLGSWGSMGAAIVLVVSSALAAGCDEPMRVGARGASEDGRDGGAQVFGADAGLDDLDEADANVDRTGWVMDSIPGVTVATIAGGRTPGRADGVGEAAQFNNPVNLVIEPSGSLLVTDFEIGLVRRVTPDGQVSTVVPAGTLGRPFGIVFSSTGQLFVETDIDPFGDHNEYTGSVWRIDLATGVPTAVMNDIGRPRGMAALPDGTIALSDLMTQTVRILDPATSELSTVAGMDRSAAFANGDGPNARFNEAYGAALLPDGDLVVADRLNHCVRRVALSGAVSMFAGDGVKGMKDGPAKQARFNAPKDVAVDAAGNVYVTDNGNYLIRRIDTNGNVRTVAGDGAPGYLDGDGVGVRFYGEEGIAVTPDGKILYVADGTNGEGNRPYNRVRKVTIP